MRGWRPLYTYIRSTTLTLRADGIPAALPMAIDKYHQKGIMGTNGLMIAVQATLAVHEVRQKVALSHCRSPEARPGMDCVEEVSRCCHSAVRNEELMTRGLEGVR